MSYRVRLSSSAAATIEVYADREWNPSDPEEADIAASVGAWRAADDSYQEPYNRRFVAHARDGLRAAHADLVLAVEAERAAAGDSG